MKVSCGEARRAGGVAALLSLILLFNGVVSAQTTAPKGSANPARPAGTRRTTPGKATAAEAGQFVAHAEQRLTELNLKVARASWIQENFITDDTEALADRKSGAAGMP